MNLPIEARPSASLNAPTPQLVNITHLIYALHAFSVFTGIVGAATVVGMMVTGWPSLIAVIINYVKRSETRGTWLESHFRWQIRTFWFALLWGAIGVVLILSIVGAIIGIPLFIVVGLWVVYRVARGWLRLLSEKSIGRA
jgi:uncharacterized membrane protein